MGKASSTPARYILSGLQSSRGFIVAAANDRRATDMGEVVDIGHDEADIKCEECVGRH